MKAFLGMLMVLIVSGDDEVTVKGILGDSVLLPCPCLNRDLRKEFRWQMEEPNKTKVFVHNGSTSGFDYKYEGRAEIFLDEDIYNCSLLLTNITADDHGKYRCSYNQGTYRRSFVILNISANYSVCQKKFATSPTHVFQCDVEGRYRNAEIQWYLDGQLLTNSSTTNITQTYTLDAYTGLYRFDSKLNTVLTSTAEPTCHVEAKGISITITNCTTTGVPTAIKQPKEPGDYLHRYFKVIPIVLVLGFSLVLWRRWKISQGLPRMRKAETDNFNC